jgi:tetratricopeptide (TPR) repeat protein
MAMTGEFVADVEKVIAAYTEANRPQAQMLIEELERMAHEPATARMGDQCYALQAKLCVKMGLYEQAIAAVNRALQLMPVDEKLTVLRGDIYRQLQDYSHAMQDYSSVVDANTEAVTAYWHRAEMSLATGNFQLALEDINKALKHEPRQLWLIYLRAQALVGLQRMREAIADYLTVAQLCPKGEPLRAKAKDRLRELGMR